MTEDDQDILLTIDTDDVESKGEPVKLNPELPISHITCTECDNSVVSQLLENNIVTD